MKNVVVVGAGASGLMAAYAAARNGNNVTVLEKNEKAGKKIYITGKGRCNVTNDVVPAEFLQNVVSNAKFLTSCIYTFPPARLQELLESGGLRLKTERGNRVFPASDKASDVIKCLQKLCVDAGVEFRFHENVTEIVKMQSTAFRIQCNTDEYFADAVIVCTGGESYPGTGSTGDGYRIAEKFGHTVFARRAALCGIECDMGSGLSALQGLSLKNVRLSAERNGKCIGSFFGEMLFTHFGISGPIVLSLSSLLNKYDLREVRLAVDLKPALDEQTLDRRLVREFDANKNKQLQSVFAALLPKSLIVPVLVQSGVSPVLPVNSVTKVDRTAIANVLKSFALRPLALRPLSEAIVTAGGIDVREITPKTMESKKVSGLYFCGETLDVDAYTGGFNLQIAFSTGFAAGNAI